MVLEKQGCDLRSPEKQEKRGNSYLLDHSDEFREGPVELVQDAVEERCSHIFVRTQQLRHVSLQQQRRARLWTNQRTEGGA